MNAGINNGLAGIRAGLAIGALLGGIAGSWGTARGQIPVMQGITVTSYSISAAAASPADPATLSLQSTDNVAFDPGVQFGSTTGDQVDGTNWNLLAIGIDYSEVAPGLANIVGLQVESSPTSLAIGDSASGQWALSYVDAQQYDLLIADGVTLTTATLTPDGGSPIDLTTASPGTVFPVGSYTLDFAGALNTADQSLVMAMSTAAVPEPATLGLAAAGLGGAAAGFWRRRRKRVG